MITLRRARPLLGTLVEIRVQGHDEIALQRALDEGFTTIARIHRLMSFHESGSDVSRLNREATSRPVMVSPETYRVLSIAGHISAVSNGIFDITVAAELIRRSLLPVWPDTVVPCGPASWRDVELLPEHRVRFRRPLMIDLGGIAKGFAVDQAIEALLQSSVVSVVVNAGGDLRVAGTNSETIYRRHPFRSDQLVPSWDVYDAAVATSSVTVARAIDSTTGPHVYPADHGAPTRFASVSVKASTCVVADALTKVLMLGNRDAIDSLDAFDAQALIVGWDGQASASQPGPPGNRHRASGKQRAFATGVDYG